MPRPCNYNFMHLDIEPSVLEMIQFDISFSSEKSVSDDNLRKPTVWQASKSSVYEMHAGCVLEISLFKVRFACDILKLSSMWKN